MAPRPTTPDSAGDLVTELTPRAVGGRVVYAAPFDPATDRAAIPSAPKPRRHFSHAAETRSFFIGLAAGVLAALVLDPEHSRP